MSFPRVNLPSWRFCARPLGRHRVQTPRTPTYIVRAAHAAPPPPPPPLDLHAIDRKWQQRWAAAADAVTAGRPSSRSKSYVLAMFPYPSGALHMGHVRNYAVADVLARFRAMQGHTVVHPMGWDAFGLPAENAAIERGVHPAQWTRENTRKMKEQLQAINSSVDWTREFMTCDPEFYKHTQRLFLLLYQHGLAYQAEARVNYDPVDRTVLANEQVDANGCSWRSGAKVEQRMLRQWFLRITAYRDRLLKDLDFLGENNKWPERVLSMQRHWLGRSRGATIQFGLVQAASQTTEGSVKVFTTRPDTLYGVQYLAVSASHPLVQKAAETDPDLNAFLGLLPSLTPDSKEGFQLPNVYGKNPLAALPSADNFVHQPLPVFVAPYVLEGYGSDVVMGVPAHDARDFAFWAQNAPNKPVRQVVLPVQTTTVTVNPPTGPFTDHGVLSTSCGPFSGLASQEAAEKIIAALAENGNAAPSETWRLRDWLISRQRYWGTPIPIVHCDSCGAVPVPVDQLPVQLPDVDGAWFKSRTGNPLEAAEDWFNVPCPKCGSPAKRDTDTMDTFMDSSWYFFRFADPHNTNVPFSPEKANATMPVDLYIGGIEHAILHLLYARFIAKFCATIDLWPRGNQPDVCGEPFQKLLSQGMVHGKTYSDPQTGRFLRPDEVDLSDPDAPRVVPSGQRPHVSFEKMSKSKHNGVEPSSFIAKYGADVTRAHILFQAPVTEILEWEEGRIVGIQRWFQRIWRLVNSASSLATTNQSESYDVGPATFNSAETALHNIIHDTTSSITRSLSETHSLNTCISDLMELTNHIHDAAYPSPEATAVRSALVFQATRALVLLLAPFAPAFASECWEHLLKHTNVAPTEGKQYMDIFSQGFPVVQASGRLKASTQTCVIMENGRKRFETELPMAPADMKGPELQEWVLREFHQTAAGTTWFARKGESWDRVVVVKGGKALNFVRKG